MVLTRVTSSLSSVVDDFVTCLCLREGDGDGVYGPGYGGGGWCGLWCGVDVLVV